VRKTLIRHIAGFSAVVVLLSAGAAAPLAAEQLTLERALAIAFAQSPTMQNAALSLEISERNLKAQQASLKSQFNLTITPYEYSKNRVFNELVSQYNNQEQTSSSAQFSITQPIKWTDGTLSVVESVDWREASSSFTGSVKEATYNNSLFLRFNQPLFTYNRTMMALKELRLALENAQLNFAIQKLQIESRVTQQFLDLYYSQRSVEITREEYANATESYQIIESKVDAGISAQEELFQADLTQANSRAALENSQNQFANALDNFKILLGVPLDAEFDVVADVQKMLVDVDLNLALEHGLRHRMELRQQDIAIESALNDLVRTGAQNEFKGSVDLTYGLTGTNEEFSEVYRSPTRNQSVALNFTIPLFDWGEKKHRLAASAAQVESQRLSATEQEKQIVYEIRQAFRSLQNQRTQIEIAEKNVTNARLTYDINLERYKNGDLSSKDISFYQTQLSREQLNEVAALINYQVALLDLKIRTLWDFARQQSVLE
jgi:outer membrane protein TolC